MADALLLPLTAHVRHEQATLALDLQLRLEAPWSTLFGPSGSGKSTLLRVLNGAFTPQIGRVVAGKQVLLDTARSIAMPPDRRPLRTAPQAPALFPHRSVRDNLLFAAPGRMPLLDQVADILHLRPLLSRKPRLLSGGEQQRVNIGRATLAAIAAHSFLLLDEPFTGMDFQLRDIAAPALQHLLAQHSVPVLSVTHDLGEVFLLQPEVFRLESGRIAAQGPAATVLETERRTLLARLHG